MNMGWKGFVMVGVDSILGRGNVLLMEWGNWVMENGEDEMFV